MKTIAALLLAVFGFPVWAATYYLSPTGDDANTGVSAAAAWMSPDHPLACGDTIVAIASADYDYRNFQGGKWGVVRCPAKDDVAWLKCERFDACKISIDALPIRAFGMKVSQPFWGVQGWEVTNLSANGRDTGSCFDAGSHHTIFADNVVNGCGATGIGVQDYGVAVGNIVYAAGRSNTDCHSGIGAYAPQPYDRAPGTHIYLAGNFVWSTTNPEKSSCYDGNGIISDWIANHSCTETFSGRVLIENNLSLSNGGVGVRVEYSGAENYSNGKCQGGAGPTEFSPQIARRNTTWGNGGGCYAFGSRNGGELQVQQADNVGFFANLAVATARELYCNKYPSLRNPPFPIGSFALLGAFQVAGGSKADKVEGNWLYSMAGNPLQITDRQGKLVTDSSFAYGSNVLGVDPRLAHPATPLAPKCAGFASTVACMAGVVADFKPRNPKAAAYGYQTPVATSTYDLLFPQWLCHVTLPAGLITMGCAQGAATAGEEVRPVRGGGEGGSARTVTRGFGVEAVQ